MHITYEVRTTRGIPALAFDNIVRAKQFVQETPHAKNWRIFKITRTEEEVA